MRDDETYKRMNCFIEELASHYVGNMQIWGGAGFLGH